MSREYFDHRTFCGPFIGSDPSPDLALAVIIPAFAESELIHTLESLFECDLPDSHTEVLIIINDSELSDSKVKTSNKVVYTKVNDWIENCRKDRISFYANYFSDLPAKKAGVGLARKIGMDEAARRFKTLGKDGLLINLDADCLVRSDYLVTIFRYFLNHPEKECASIHFEHPTEGSEFPQVVYESVIQYELHLRYYRQAQIYTGLPYAFHTVGSAMAVRSEAYLAQGGMNTRQAGEDFYFMHKYTRIGKCGSIAETAVFPSPRISGRVPFGTGKAITRALKGYEQKTYNLLSFEALCPWVGNVEAEPSTTLLSFLEENNWESVLNEIKRNTASQSSFRKRFFQWFDAFKLIKYLHYMRDNFYSDVPVRGEATKLARKVYQANLMGWSTSSILNWYREKDLAT